MRQASLAVQTEQILLDRLVSGEFRPGDRLPTEHELAADYGVSRATVRVAIAALVRRGMVVQRHGIGSFAAVGSSLTNDLAHAVDLAELLARHGATTRIVFDSIAVEASSAHVAGRLSIDPGDNVVVAAKRFVADDTTLVYVVNSIPTAVLGADLVATVLERPDVTEPLFAFLEGTVGVRLGPQVARLRAELGADIDHPGSSVAASTPVLHIEEVGFTDRNQPIWHSQTWFPPGTMSFELVRNRIGAFS